MCCSSPASSGVRSDVPPWATAADRWHRLLTVTEWDRRRFLGWGAGAAATIGLAACGRSPTHSTSPSPSSTVAPKPAEPTDWATLRHALSGPLLLPADVGYATAIQLFDSRYDSVRPAALARCQTPSDIQRCIAFARAHGLAPIPRSGGHSYGGYSTGPGLVIDVAGMSAVQSGVPVTVGGGALHVDVYRGLNADGMSIPAGSCPTVGIAGLTLGGGLGVVGRRYGLACDALTSVTMVTADSVMRTVDAAHDAELFWACRGGGGGNFGIVTSFRFIPFTTGEITLVSLSWPWAAASQVLPAWLDWAPHAPDPLWSNLVLQTLPGRPGPTVHVGVVWSGTPSDLTPLLRGLDTATGSSGATQYNETTSFAHAMLVEAGCSTLNGASCRLQTQGGSLPRTPTLAKSDYLDRPLNNAGVAALLAGIDHRRSEGTTAALGFDAYGGAINRVAPDATAFVHRSSLATVQYNVDFDPGTSTTELAADQAFLDQWYATLRPHVSGAAYQNHIDPRLTGWAHAYYGQNLSRLQQVKATVDPDNVFRFAQSIPLPPP